ncbi:MAG: ribosomal protein S18-alanine N-acetyltransferase [Anaerolineales bacterium]|nr:ribosomal protein S18-alanine N-acetyltransferase [Anaerolineales bacterium]
MRFSIRRMTLGDVEQVIAIDQASFNLPWPERTFRYEVAENSASRPWIVDVDGRVAAMIVVWFIIDEAHIATIATHPDFRRQGFGRKLLIHALNTAKDEGAKTALLEVRVSNDVAQEMYRKLGFVEVNRRLQYYSDNGEDAILMTASLL